MGIYTYCWPCTLTLTLCMIVPWSRDGVVFLASTHLVTSSHLPCPDSTDAHRPPLGAQVPPPPKWRPFPQGPRTLPFQGPEQFNIRMKLVALYQAVLTCRRCTTSSSYVHTVSIRYQAPPSCTTLGGIQMFIIRMNLVAPHQAIQYQAAHSCTTAGSIKLFNVRPHQVVVS